MLSPFHFILALLSKTFIVWLISSQHNAKSTFQGTETNLVALVGTKQQLHKTRARKW